MVMWIQIFKVKKIPKENASYRCLSVKMPDSTVKVKRKYYSQTLLEECKYEIKKTKMENLMNDESDDDESDNDETESDNETNNDESNE